jgi:hypothetical protein
VGEPCASPSLVTFMGKRSETSIERQYQAKPEPGTGSDVARTCTGRRALRGKPSARIIAGRQGDDPPTPAPPTFRPRSPRIGSPKPISLERGLDRWARPLTPEECPFPDITAGAPVGPGASSRAPASGLWPSRRAGQHKSSIKLGCGCGPDRSQTYAWSSWGKQRSE